MNAFLVLGFCVPHPFPCFPPGFEGVGGYVGGWAWTKESLLKRCTFLRYSFSVCGKIAFDCARKEATLLALSPSLWVSLSLCLPVSLKNKQAKNQNKETNKKQTNKQKQTNKKPNKKTKQRNKQKTNNKQNTKKPNKQQKQLQYNVTARWQLSDYYATVSGTFTRGFTPDIKRKIKTHDTKNPRQNKKINIKTQESNKTHHKHHTVFSYKHDNNE